MQVHPATIDQQQRVARAKIAQVDRRDIAARTVLGGGVLFVERNCARLRDRSENLVARNRAGILDVDFIHHRDRQHVVDFRALDLRAGDDDLAFGLQRRGRRFGLLCVDSAGGNHAATAHQGKPAQKFHRHHYSPHFSIISCDCAHCANSAGHWLMTCSGLPRPQP